jgi:serine/threonine protein kinase
LIDQELAIGVRLGEQLGRGSFGTVYRGRHVALDIDVAVKLITGVDFASGGLEHTLKEARLMARLDHPNLLRIFDAGRSGPSVYFVLDLMNGGSCKSLRNLPGDRAMSVAKQLLSGLQALHDARILHRDIKPANCLLRAEDGRVKLADLGIAVEFGTGTRPLLEAAGTIPFMAPELFEAPPEFSERSDLYALGMTLACMVLDADPFPRGAFDVLHSWIVHGTRPDVPSQRPDLLPALTELINRMISLRRADRPPSVGEALAALSGETQGTPVARATPLGEGAARIGPWVLGEEVYSSSNWLGHVATHAGSGAPARVTRLQPKSRLLGISKVILEAAARASRLDHPSLIEVIDWGMFEGCPYVVTGPQGRSLGDLIRTGNPCQEHVAIGFAMSLADALRYLHGLGLVYQNLDPGSAVVAADARSARLSWPVYCVPAGSPVNAPAGQWQRIVVPAYSAPEALSNTTATIEPSVDMFGLGAILYSLLTGNEAYAKARQSTILPDLREFAPAVTAPTARLVAELTHPDSARRPVAASVCEELARIGRGIGIARDGGPRRATR